MTRHRIASSACAVLLFLSFSAWSLPLAFGVECVTVDRRLAPKSTNVAAAVNAEGRGDIPPAKLAHLIPWGSGAASVVSDLLQAGVRVDVAGAPFTLEYTDNADAGGIFKSTDRILPIRSRVVSVQGENVQKPFTAEPAELAEPSFVIPRVLRILR